MCGIAGLLVGDRTSAGELTDELARMLPPLAHRGPDGEGTWTDDEAGIGLGHRRLAIVDLSPSGAQPMVSADGRWVISFNGEVYGYRELRARIERRGARFRGSSDTEVLLELVALDGVEAALDQLNAMYGLALWDRRDRELWLARDPVGEKPLYVREGPDRMAFASEIGAVRAVSGFRGAIDPAALNAYLLLGYVPAPLTIDDGVTKLEAGEWRCYGRDGTVRTGRTDAATLESVELGDDALFAAITDAVAIRTVADVPVGVFLSGGIDSTLVAALAARSGTTRTFTAAFDEHSHDESEHAAAVARAIGTDHTELLVDVADGIATARAIPRIYGEPFGDPSAIPTHLIARAARASVTVALTGDGGDELFGGYNRLVAGARLDRLRHRLPAPLRLRLARAAWSFSPATIDRWTGRAATMTRRPAIPNAGEKLHKAATVLGAASAQEAIAALVGLWPDPVALTGSADRYDLAVLTARFEDDLLELDRRLTLPELMLAKVDRATMAVGLEARPPLLDPRVVAIARAVPFAEHVSRGQGKQLLRRAVARLVDPALLDRPKMGFDPPIGEWLRGPLRSWADDLLQPDALRASGVTGTAEVARSWSRHLSGASTEEQRLWTLLQYQLWFHDVGDRPAPVPRPKPARVTSGADLEIRPYRSEDEEPVNQLLAAAMKSSPTDDRYRRLFAWKHEANPFGTSPAWVAMDDGRVVGYRPFLRWRFEADGRTHDAVRAVDTATDPSAQGRGVFRALTLHALDQLRAQDIGFVFNTPNDQSRPGYMKMGWRTVGRLTPWVRPGRLLSAPAMVRGRAPASLWAEPCGTGVTAADAFADDTAVERLLAAVDRSDDRLRTVRSAAYLRWRYDHELLGYRVLTLGADLEEGACCFRLRTRGTATEATICELLVPGRDGGARRALIRRVLQETGADYALLLGGRPVDALIPLPGHGPTLVWREVCEHEMRELAAWDLSLGDIELF
jgi:asparagine synthase (glutamine-hydrolysing)